MVYNRIAVFGHRGWASSAVVDALAATGAPLKVLYRAESNAADLAANIATVPVDLTNQEELIEALQDIDIFM